MFFPFPTLLDDQANVSDVVSALCGGWKARVWGGSDGSGTEGQHFRGRTPPAVRKYTSPERRASHRHACSLQGRHRQTQQGETAFLSFLSRSFSVVLQQIMDLFSSTSWTCSPAHHVQVVDHLIMYRLFTIISWTCSQLGCGQVVHHPIMYWLFTIWSCTQTCSPLRFHCNSYGFRPQIPLLRWLGQKLQSLSDFSFPAF